VGGAVVTGTGRTTVGAGRCGGIHGGGTGHTGGGNSGADGAGGTGSTTGVEIGVTGASPGPGKGEPGNGVGRTGTVAGAEPLAWGDEPSGTDPAPACSGCAALADCLGLDDGATAMAGGSAPPSRAGLPISISPATIPPSMSTTAAATASPARPGP
jgi:hypothetical protein